MDLERVYHSDLHKEIGLSSSGLTCRAKKRGIISKRCDKNSHNTYYTEIEAQALRVQVVKEAVIDETVYLEIVHAFKTLRDNRTAEIAKRLNLSIGTVGNYINRYLKSIEKSVSEQFVIFESKMNFEDFT